MYFLKSDAHLLKLNKYFHIVGEAWKMPQKLSMFDEFRLIVN